MKLKIGWKALGTALGNAMKPLLLGAVGGGNSSPGGVWDGMLDEMRLKWGNSSADWVAADYATQHDANFAVLGEIEDVNTHGTTILIR